MSVAKSSATLFDVRNATPPDGLLLDTSFIASATIAQMEYHNEAKTFLQKIIDNKTVVIYSALTELEFWNACLKLEVERQKGIPRNKAMAFLKTNPYQLKNCTKACVQYMKLFVEDMTKMSAIKVQIADVIKDVKAMQKATIYNLYTYDTLQVATMFYCDLNNIAAIDKHIQKCSGLNTYTIL